MEDNHVCSQMETLREISVNVAEVKSDIKALDKRINGSIDDFRVHIEHGGKWRLAIASIGVALVLNVVAFAYMFGQLNKTVCVNERIIQRILGKYELIRTDKDLIARA